MMKTVRMTSPAGSAAKARRVFALLLVCGCAGVAPAQTPQPVATPQAAATRPAATESSITVQQIVARQEAHYATAANAQGIAVYSEARLNAAGQPTSQETQYIYFAFAGDRSVTLAMPEAAAKLYATSEGTIPWPHVTAATLVSGDTVYTIHPPRETGTTMPRVISVPFNPAVHENNPLVAFHFRQVADEQMPLRELARAIPDMAQRPTVTDVNFGGKPYIQVDFANASTPGEHLYYIVDPAHDYMPVQISRVSNGKTLSRSNILLAHTPEGFWMPARRERITYNAAGTPETRQTWHYDYVAVNQGLAPMALTLMYFNLPLSTPVLNAAGTQSTAPPAQTPAARTPRPTPAVTPIPRAVSTPMRVPLQ